MEQFKVGDKVKLIPDILSEESLHWAAIPNKVYIPDILTITNVNESVAWEEPAKELGTLTFKEMGFTWPMWWFTKVDQKDQGVKESENKLMVEELYWPFIEEMARVMTFYKTKYPPKNHLKPMNKEKLLAAAQRHMIELWKGNETDTDRTSHIAKVATNCMMYYIQTKNSD